MTRREPTAEQIAALKSFAAHYGRRWKSTLTDEYWPRARLWTGPKGDDQRIGSILHGIRNEFGPSWLHAYQFPKEGDQ